MHRRTFLQAPFALAAQAASKRPNVLILLADDLGSADLGSYGGEIETPNLDRLAVQGMRFEQFCSFPVCSPTRSALLTGRSPMRLGIGYTVIRPWSNYGLPLNEHLLPQSFKAAGYQTAITGKWHLGHSRKAYLPHNRGFDHAYGHVNGAIDYYTHMREGGLDWHRNGASVREEGYSTDLIANEAVRWLGGRDKSKPFLLYVPFNAPHAPLEAPEALIDKYARIADKKRRVFAAMVDAMDSAAGRVLKKLDEEGVSDDTAMLFLSDNGGPIEQGARNTPLRGAKGSVYEGGLRVPAILRWPGHIRPGTRSRQLTTVMDVFPTLAAAAGVTPMNRLPFDGRNLWKDLTSGKAAPREDLFFAIERAGRTQYAVRRNNWKLIRETSGGEVKDALYNLDEDPNETTDIAGRHAALAKDLARCVEPWRAVYPKDGMHLTTSPPPGWKAPALWAEAAG
ncbi:MAG: arylsulfatase [Bryobacteraceae bacterium]